MHIQNPRKILDPSQILDKHQLLDARLVLDPRQSFISIRNPLDTYNFSTYAIHVTHKHTQLSRFSCSYSSNKKRLYCFRVSFT